MNKVLTRASSAAFGCSHQVLADRSLDSRGTCRRAGDHMETTPGATARKIHSTGAN